MIDKKAIILASLFGRGPCLQGFCGGSASVGAITELLNNPNPQDDQFLAVREILISNFGNLNPNLQALGKIFNRDPYSLEIVQTYIYGNSLLDGLSSAHLGILLEELKKGMNIPDDEVASAVIAVLKKLLPKKTGPYTHLNMVLWLALQRNETNVAAVQDCMVSWGTIEKIDKADENIFEIVMTLCMVDNFKSLQLVQKQKIVLAERSVFSSILDLNTDRTSDSQPWFSVHRGFLIEEIDTAITENLETYTNRVLDLYRGRFA